MIRRSTRHSTLVRPISDHVVRRLLLEAIGAAPPSAGRHVDLEGRYTYPSEDSLSSRGFYEGKGWTARRVSPQRPQRTQAATTMDIVPSTVTIFSRLLILAD